SATGTDLIQFAGEAAETGARSPQVVRSQLVDAGPSRHAAHRIAEHLRRHAISPNTARLVDRAEHPTMRDARRSYPRVDAVLHPGRNGNRPHCPPLPTESAVTQCSSRC